MKKIVPESGIELVTLAIAALSPAFALDNLYVGIPTGVVIALALWAVMRKTTHPKGSVRTAYLFGSVMVRCFSAIFEQMAYMKVLIYVPPEILPLGLPAVTWAWAFTLFMLSTAVWFSYARIVETKEAEEDRQYAADLARYEAQEAARQEAEAAAVRKAEEERRMAEAERKAAETEAERKAAELEAVRAENPSAATVIEWKERISAAEAAFKAQHQRPPKQKELAVILNTTDRTIRYYQNKNGGNEKAHAAPSGSAAGE